MKRKLVILGLILALAATPLMACAQATTPAAPEVEPIKIGVLLDQTSWGSATDLLTIPGYKFAVDQVGSINGRPIEIIFEDTGANPKQAMDKARKLSERDDIVLALGIGYSGVASAVSPYFTQNKIPMIPLYAYHFEVAREDNWFYFPIGANAMFGYGSGIFAAEELGAKTATTAALDFAGPHEYTEGFRRGFEERGGKVIQNQWFATDVVDFSSYILNMEEADILALTIFGTMDVAFFAQYRELVQPGDYPVLWLWDEFDFEVNRQLLNGPAEIPAYSAASFSFKDAQTKEAFGKSYLELYGAGIPFDNAPFYLAYYACSIGLQALTMTGGEGGDALHEAMETMDWESVRGRVKFTDRLMDSIIEIRKAEAGDRHYEMVPVKQYRTHGEWNADKSDMILTQVK